MRTDRTRLAILAALTAASCHCGTAPGDESPSAPFGEADVARPSAGWRRDVSMWTGPDDPASARPEPPGAFTAIDPAEVRRRLWTEPAPTVYVPPTPERAAALSALIRGLMSDPPPEPEALADMAFQAGYQVHAWTVGGQRLLAVVEPPTRQTGGGAFVFRADPSPGPPVILQAPHAFHDLGTERIALALLVHGRTWPRALFVNTVHRYMDIDGQKREREAAPADPCHNSGHLFAVATAAALDAEPAAEIVQLHGFGDDGEPGPAVVVSAGDREAATVRTRQIAERLREALEVPVALFPEDDTRLGATANVQGRLVRDRGGEATFVHIELAPDLRRRLQRDTHALARFADALRPQAGVSADLEQL